MTCKASRAVIAFLSITYFHTNTNEKRIFLEKKAVGNGDRKIVHKKETI